MPELPEVETIRQILIPDLHGKVIKKASLSLPRILLDCSPVEFKALIINQKINQLLRRGKYLIFELSTSALIIHLGMTGQLTFAKNGSQKKNKFNKTITGLEISQGPHSKDKHTHMIIDLPGGHLLFRDVRTFGKIIFVKNGNWNSHPRISKLGVEPLEIRHSFKKSLPQSKRFIKSLLLDQSFIAGIGNIYCDEALFEARIHPKKQVDHINTIQWTSLIKAVKKVIKRGIKNSGTTFRDYVKPDQTKGSNQEKLNVYGRGGELCTICCNELIKSVVAQRGTVHCPVCQTLK